MKQRIKINFREVIDLLIEFSYLAVIFAVPIYFAFTFPTYNIFELNKLVLFKVLIWLLFFLTAVKLIFYKVKFPFKKYFLFPAIFIIGLGFTLFFSTNLQQSFFGSYSWQAGYLTYLFYFLYFALVFFNLLTIGDGKNDGSGSWQKRIKRIFVTISFSGFIVALYGLLQILNLDFLLWSEDPFLTKRTISTFGQPNFLASWLLLVIPVSAYLFYQHKKFLLKFFYFLVLITELICLFCTSSRGGIIALVLAIVLFAFYLLSVLKLKKTQKILIILGVFLTSVALFLGFNFFSQGRLLSLFDFQSGSSAARVNFYSAAAEMIMKKPIFGYGLENSGEIFIDYYQPDWGIHGNVNATTDRAHNLILDILLSAGFFGLIFFVILYYYFFRLAVDNIRQEKMKGLSLALSLGVFAYLISLMFSFTIVAGEVYFWFYLAVLAAINIGQSDLIKIEPRSFKKSFWPVKIILVVIIFLFTGKGIVYEFKTLSADYYFNKLFYALATEQYFNAFLLDNCLQEVVVNPVNQEKYYLFLADKLSDFYPQIKDPFSRKVVREKLIKLNQKINAQGYESLLIKGKINTVLENYPLAEKYFLAVVAKTPYWPKVYLELGNLLLKEGRKPEAIINYQLIDKILPDTSDSRLNEAHREVVKLHRKIIFKKLGDLYFAAGDFSEAEKNYQEAYLNDLNDFTLLKDIANTYYLRGDLNKALEYNLHGLTRNPNDYNWFLSVALIYQEMGNFTEAKKYFNSALELAPNNENLNNFFNF